MRQFDVGDFVYLQRQPNDTLDTASSHTILRIKAIRASCVLELQGADGHTIRDHSENCAPCHLPNLDPTIITSTWIPPLDYPCQVCQRTDDADQMLLCDNYNGGYYLFCLKPDFIQVPADIWYYSSCYPTAPWFLLRPCHTQPPLVHYIYIYVCVCVCASLFGLLVSTFD